MKFKDKNWGKTNKERVLDNERQELASINERIRDRTRLILSKEASAWDLVKLRQEKTLLGQDQNASEKLMKKLAKLSERHK